MSDGASAKVPVTAIVAARNEAGNIEACLASLDWVSEILVVENESTDGTAAIARRAGAFVHQQPFTTIGGMRNFAIARAKSDWILVLDADERCTSELAREIARVVASGPACDAFQIRRRNFFLGREIRHGGWGTDHPIRLFRNHLRYDDSEVHEHVVVNSDVGSLSSTIDHTPYSSLDEYFTKLNRYSRAWAHQHYQRGRRATVWHILVRPPARFVSSYLVRAGWLDGARGILLAWLSAASVLAKYARLWEMSLRQE